jgi:hypothetical protein
MSKLGTTLKMALRTGNRLTPFDFMIPSFSALSIGKRLIEGSGGIPTNPAQSRSKPGGQLEP